MQFYDAHVHFFYDGSLDSLKKEYLEMDGFLGATLIILEEAPAEKEIFLKLIPGAYHNMMVPDIIYSPAHMSCLQASGRLSFIPCLDTRFFLSDHLSIEHYIQKGYMSVKVLYVPEKDEAIKIEGWELALKRTVSESERLVADMIAECASLCVPVLFHVDLNRYSGYIYELMSAFPNTLFNIPHMGSSRKRMVEALSKYPNCYTDFASLLPFMKTAPEGYRNFIQAFPDRVLFGSDALFGNLSMVKEYVDYVKTFLGEDLLEKVTCGNFRQFYHLEKG
ncbi:MAG: amidohydrolase family protein [Smithellaceae bacterium]